jgi:predicted transposase YbfD/YdcC
MDLITILRQIPDPRVNRTKRHLLEDILFLSICATLGGCDCFTEIAIFGEAHLEWLRKYVPLANGVPSHDTIGRLFAHLDPNKFSQILHQYLASMQDMLGQAPKHLAIDGKTMSQSARHGQGSKAVHVVSAWCSELQLSFGEVAVNEKSNEITAIPELLSMLDLNQRVVTIDAMGCQKAILAQIVTQKGDYIVALKANQRLLYQEAKDYFDRFQPQPCYEEQETRGDVLETRRLSVLSAAGWLTEAQAWSGLQTVVRLERSYGEKREVRYFISSLAPQYGQWAKNIRQHWSIENQLHWQLDVSFSEDKSSISNINAPLNMNIIRKFALNMIKQDKSAKGSVKSKRLKAGWNIKFLEHIINNFSNN